MALSNPYIILTSYPLLLTEISLSPMYLSLAAILQYLYCARCTRASAENALQMAAKMAATKMSPVTELFIGGGCGGEGDVYMMEC